MDLIQEKRAPDFVRIDAAIVVNNRPPHLARARNYVIGLLMLAGVIVFITLGIRAESRVFSFLSFGAALAMSPFLVARAFSDDATRYAKTQLDQICAKREAEALRGAPGDDDCSATRR